MTEKEKNSMLFREPDTYKINVLINSVMLAIHLILMVLYVLAHVKVMIIANVVSSIFYLLGYIFIKRGRTIGFFSLVFVEVAIHAILACLYIGYDAGFQLWFFALAALYFYPQFSNPGRIPRRLSVTFPIFSIILYFVLFFEHIYCVIPDCLVSQRMHYVMDGFNSLAVFIAISFFTYLFATSIIRSRNRMNYQMNHDALTGLMNRSALHQVTDEAIARSDRTGEPFSLAMVDIDNFKYINDNYGYEFGNFVIFSVADEIRKITDDEEFSAGRYGGEKFLFVYTREPSSEAMKYKMEKFRASIEHMQLNSGGREVHITVSIGVAKFQKGDDYDIVLKQAHDNLYRAKREGKNRVI